MKTVFYNLVSLVTEYVTGLNYNNLANWSELEYYVDMKENIAWMLNGGIAVIIVVIMTIMLYTLFEGKTTKN